MRICLAGALSAMFSWFINKATLIFFGSRVIVSLVPLTEESMKTGAAIILNAPILLTHLIFGLIEAISDQVHSKNGLFAGFASIIGHTFFGYITNIAYIYRGQYILGVFSGYIVHMLWNLFVMEFIVNKQRRDKF